MIEASEDIIQEARMPPFLAQAIDSPALQAAANPSFVDYALEMYEGDAYQGWVHVPRNATLSDKIMNSGAAYKALALTDRVDRVQFVRYRWDGLDTPRGRVLSFLNTYKLAVAALNVVSNMSAYQRWLGSLDPTAAATVEAATCVTTNYDLAPWVRDATGADATDSLRRMVEQVFTDLSLATSACLGEIAQEAALVALGQVITQSAPKVAAKLAGPLGRVLLAIGVTNEAIPVATS